MSEREKAQMSDDELDKLLESGLPELPPPDDVVAEVTPWRRATDRVFAGLAMTMLTLNFLGLNYIIPAIGIVLMLLGLRTLRRVNGWFRVCFVLTVVRVVQFFALCILNTTIYQQTFAQSAAGTALTWFGAALGLAASVCLWRALCDVRRRAGADGGADAGAAFVLWYVFVLILAALKYEGIIIPIAMVVAYILIIRGLVKLSNELEQTGYAIEPVPTRVSDKAIVIAVAAVVTVGVVCGYSFGSSYKMDWSPVTEAEQGQQETERRLTGLGFPEDVLSDLAPEDLEKLSGAVQVVCDEPETHEENGGGPETRNVAVLLSGDGDERWIIIHHFRWNDSRRFTGTECMQIWPTYRNTPDGWSASETDDADAVFGRVLYTSGEESFCAPFWYLGSKSYEYDSMFWGTRNVTDIFAAFSAPKGRTENLRGYVAYEAICRDPRYILDSWVNYFHQQSWLQYPAVSAMEKSQSGEWSTDSTFSITQYAMQFFRLDDGSIDMAD